MIEINALRKHWQSVDYIRRNPQMDREQIKYMLDLDDEKLDKLIAFSRFYYEDDIV